MDKTGAVTAKLCKETTVDILWACHESRRAGKDADGGKNRGQEEERTTENEVDGRNKKDGTDEYGRNERPSL